MPDGQSSLSTPPPGSNILEVEVCRVESDARNQDESKTEVELRTRDRGESGESVSEVSIAETS